MTLSDSVALANLTRIEKFTSEPSLTHGERGVLTDRASSPTQIALASPESKLRYVVLSSALTKQCTLCHLFL